MLGPPTGLGCSALLTVVLQSVVGFSAHVNVYPSEMKHMGRGPLRTKRGGLAFSLLLSLSLLPVLCTHTLTHAKFLSFPPSLPQSLLPSLPEDKPAFHCGLSSHFLLLLLTLHITAGFCALTLFYLPRLRLCLIVSSHSQPALIWQNDLL